MKFDEKILWAIGALVLVTLVIFHRQPKPGEAPEFVSPVDMIGESFTPFNTNMTRGPAYLMYNQPWAFAPPVGNVLPTITIGQQGQTVQAPASFTNRFSSCETC
jgi:hypothetical protein